MTHTSFSFDLKVCIFFSKLCKETNFDQVVNSSKANNTIQTDIMGIFKNNCQNFEL